jgi:hypothetical protein
LAGGRKEGNKRLHPIGEKAFDRKVLRVIEGGCVWKGKPAQLIGGRFLPHIPFKYAGKSRQIALAYILNLCYDMFT